MSDIQIYAGLGDADFNHWQGKAAVADQQALEAGAALRAQQRGELAVLIDQAKVVANDVSLDATARIFEATGARSTANSYGLDILWRNVRTHTVRDPVSYRAREIGACVLTQELPKPRSFSQPPKTGAHP